MHTHTILANRGPDTDSRIVRRAFIGAGLACILAFVAGVLAFQQDLGLLRSAQKTIDEDLANGALASRTAVATLQCHRYEKDMFLNLDNATTRGD